MIWGGGTPIFGNIHILRQNPPEVIQAKIPCRNLVRLRSRRFVRAASAVCHLSVMLESGRFGMVGDGWLGEDIFYAFFKLKEIGEEGLHLRKNITKC